MDHLKRSHRISKGCPSDKRGDSSFESSDSSSSSQTDADTKKKKKIFNSNSTIKKCFQNLSTYSQAQDHKSKKDFEIEMIKDLKSFAMQ